MVLGIDHPRDLMHSVNPGALGRKGLIEFKLCDVKMTNLKVELVPNDKTWFR